jgi:ureidoglycolate hydrolase
MSDVQFNHHEISLQTIDKLAATGLGERICLPGAAPDRDNANLNLWNQIFTLPGASEATYLQVKKRPYILKRMERHQKSVEIVVALNHGVILPLAPWGELNAVEQDIRAFYLPAGQGIKIYEGVWHIAPFPLEETAEVLVLFAQGTGTDDLEFQETVVQHRIVL